jgi:hypothetical protein
MWAYALSGVHYAVGRHAVQQMPELSGALGRCVPEPAARRVCGGLVAQENSGARRSEEETGSVGSRACGFGRERVKVSKRPKVSPAPRRVAPELENSECTLNKLQGFCVKLPLPLSQDS